MPLVLENDLKRLLELTLELRSRSLTPREMRNVDQAAHYLTTVQTGKKPRVYSKFLHDILNDIGLGAVFLCAAAIGQNRIAQSNISTRTAFLRQVKLANIRPETYALVIRRYEGGTVPSVVDSAVPSVNQQSDHSPGNFTSDSWSLPPMDGTVATGNATLHGIAIVFNKFLCGAIRKVEGDSKAAVTMTFPQWGGFGCLMSLDIRERDVGQLARDLFGAETKWIDQALHLVLSGGFTLIIPSSGITLKGVKDETIKEIFGTEIHDAVIDCHVHRKEVTDGKHVTECVSMILTQKKATLNLFLGLAKGLELATEMYG